MAILHPNCTVAPNAALISIERKQLGSGRVWISPPRADLAKSKDQSAQLINPCTFLSHSFFSIYRIHVHNVYIYHIQKVSTRNKWRSLVPCDPQCQYFLDTTSLPFIHTFLLFLLRRNQRERMFFLGSTTSSAPKRGFLHKMYANEACSHSSQHGQEGCGTNSVVGKANGPLYCINDVGSIFTACRVSCLHLKQGKIT